MAAKGLEHSYNKLTAKKMKDTLSSFLSHMPGMIDTPGHEDNSSLRAIIDKPPVCGKELAPLNQLQLSGFRLHPGPLPEQYRSQNYDPSSRKRRKHKKHKQSSSANVAETAGPVEMSDPNARSASSGMGTDESKEKRREKKHKKHDKDAEERKKRKKDRKKKRSKEEKSDHVDANFSAR